MPVGPDERLEHEASRWSLSSGALDLLLGKLDRDREVAAHEYERIHERLSRFFEWRGCFPPEQLADDVFDRLARKLEKGQSVDLSGTLPLSYLLGIAHNVAKEVYRRYKLEGHVVAKVDTLEAAKGRQPADERLEQLDHCLSSLAERDRELLLEYYKGEKRPKIDNRNLMADRIGVSINALRVRAHRLRQRVEKCMRNNL